MLLRRLFAAALVGAAACFVRAAEVTVIAHEPGYYTSLAKHARRWFGEMGIASTLATPAGMAGELKTAKLALLVGFERPTAAEMKTLGAFRARGGKLVVFYSSSPELAKLMGVRLLKHRTAAYPGQWSRMSFSAPVPEGMPSVILQTSSVLNAAIPEPGLGRILAVWGDRAGKSTGDAAWIETGAGWWMTHVLLADGDEHLKAQLLAAIASRVDPKLWNYRAFAARAAAEKQRLAAYAKAQVPRKGEIHAVWDHSGAGLYPGDWPRTMHELSEARVTDLFVNVAGAGFAHYPSDVLPRSKLFEQEGDQLAACLKAAKGTGIRVHAWILCFTGTRSTPERLEVFRKKGWRLAGADGKPSEYLDPSNRELQQYLLGAIHELASKYPVSGVHLDFVRWYEGTNKAKSVQAVSNFVLEARRHVKRPKWLTAAVFGKYPECVRKVGQDWTGWLEGNFVDYVVPMDYTEDMSLFTELLSRHAQKKSLARRVIVGIGVTANESRLGAKAVIDQILLTRRYGMAGVSLFDLDVTLEKRIFPYLKLGLW